MFQQIVQSLLQVADLVVLLIKKHILIVTIFLIQILYYKQIGVMLKDPQQLLVKENISILNTM